MDSPSPKQTTPSPRSPAGRGDRDRETRSFQVRVHTRGPLLRKPPPPWLRPEAWKPPRGSGVAQTRRQAAGIGVGATGTPGSGVSASGTWFCQSAQNVRGRRDGPVPGASHAQADGTGAGGLGADGHRTGALLLGPCPAPAPSRGPMATASQGTRGARGLVRRHFCAPWPGRVTRTAVTIWDHLLLCRGCGRTGSPEPVQE